MRIISAKRTTYRQNWPAYNEPQTNEMRHFQSLLFALFRNVHTPPQAKVVCVCPFQTQSFLALHNLFDGLGRRFISDLRHARSKGDIDRVPHFNSAFNYLENPEPTPILLQLITAASLPLQSVECYFAVNSTGFTTSRFTRWYDHKCGVARDDHDWVKVHFVCGVKTNVVTAVEIHDRNASTTPHLPSLLGATAKNFAVQELSADPSTTMSSQ